MPIALIGKFSIQIPPPPAGASIKNILCVSRPDVTGKGLDTLLRAVALLPPEYHLTHVGGYGNNTLKSLAAELKITDRVTFIDRCENTELPNYYRQSDCFCLLSLHEGFGIVYIEAASCGCPIVAPNIAPMNTYLWHLQTAYLINDYQDPTAVAHAIEYMCSPDGKRMAQNAVKITKRYDSTFVERYEATLYATVLKKMHLKNSFLFKSCRKVMSLLPLNGNHSTTEMLSLDEDKKLTEIKKSFPNIYSFKYMLDFLRRGGSLARFGDGEFFIICKKSIYFQSYHEKLASKLSTLLSRPESSKLLVAIPPLCDKYNNIINFYKNISFWENYWLNHFDTLKKYITQPAYGNANFSRISVFHALLLSQIKKIWDKRTVVFVVPKDGRFFYDDRLFDNITKKYEITVPKTNAFNEYDRILSECLTYPKTTLFFISAGPTATVLVADLSDNGYQALDMGHFPNAFLQYKNEGIKIANEHMPIPK